MEFYNGKKNMMIIAAVVILAIVIVVGFIFISGNSNDSSKGSTSFSSPFMVGSFVGNVSLENDSLDYAHAYKDKAHDIEYNITTMDNASALMEIYEFQGIGTPEKELSMVRNGIFTLVKLFLIVEIIILQNPMIQWELLFVKFKKKTRVMLLM